MIFTLVVAQSLLGSGSSNPDSFDTHAVFVAYLPAGACTSATTVVVTVSPGSTALYSQEGVSALIPRSQLSSTNCRPTSGPSVTSSCETSGPLLRATIVNVTSCPILAWRTSAVLDTMAMSALIGS